MLPGGSGPALQEREEYLGYILKECERMAGIINDILMLERQSQAKGDSHETVSLDKVAHQVAVALSPQAAARHLHSNQGSDAGSGGGAGHVSCCAT